MCTVALTVASALGSVYQGYAAKQAANAQAAAAEQNANIARQQAHDAVTIGGVREGQMRRSLRQLIGRQMAAAGASGVSVNSGSITDARLSSIDAMERDIDVNEMNAQRARWGHEVEAINYLNQASAARAAGSNAMTAGIIGAGTSLLSLAAPKIDEWFKGGVGASGGLYTANSNANLAENHASGIIGTNTAQTIWPGKTEFEKYGYAPYDTSSFGAGMLGVSGGEMPMRATIPGYGPSYNKGNLMKWDWDLSKRRK